MKFSTELVKLSEIKPHQRNYRRHPEDQMEHLVESIRRHGLYRNIVVARDNTILAGHGVTLACRRLEMKEVPVVRVDLDPDEPQALKILSGDNEISHLGEIDDRALSELLKEIKDTDLNGLFGTGYDDKMLANLVMITRPTSEIANINEAAEWVGMPGYDSDKPQFKLMLITDSEDERAEILKLLNIEICTRGEKIWSARYPNQERNDISSLKFEG